MTKSFRKNRPIANDGEAADVQELLISFLYKHILKYDGEEINPIYKKNFSIILEMPDNDFYNTHFIVRPNKKDGHVKVEGWPHTWDEYRELLLKEYEDVQKNE